MSKNQELKLGRELDFEIAERVMGWKYHDYSEEHRKLYKPRTGRLWVPPDSDQVYLDHSVPHYSTDIAAAWQVIEHLRGQGYQFHINSLEGSNNISVLISNPDKHSLGDMADFTVWEHESLPLAICLAALKAVEDKK